MLSKHLVHNLQYTEHNDYCPDGLEMSSVEIKIVKTIRLAFKLDTAHSDYSMNKYSEQWIKLTHWEVRMCLLESILNN